MTQSEFDDARRQAKRHIYDLVNEAADDRDRTGGGVFFALAVDAVLKDLDRYEHGVRWLIAELVIDVEILLDKIAMDYGFTSADTLEMFRRVCLDRPEDDS